MTAKFSKLIVCLVLAAASYAGGPAAAVPLIFFGEDVAGGSLPVPNASAAQASFLSRLTGVRVENFEGVAVGTQFPFNITFGADTATLSGTNTAVNTGVQNAGILGRFAISGSNYLDVGSTDAASFKLTFTAPQAAFGFFATDIGDFSGQLGISLNGGAVIAVNHTLNAPDGNGLFWGIIDVSSPFTTVEFKNIAGGTLADAFGFDDFTIGRAEQVVSVPLPGTLALLSLGLAGLGWSRRRK